MVLDLLSNTAFMGTNDGRLPSVAIRVTTETSCRRFPYNCTSLCHQQNPGHMLTAGCCVEEMRNNPDFPRLLHI